MEMRPWKNALNAAYDFAMAARLQDATLESVRVCESSI